MGVSGTEELSGVTEADFGLGNGDPAAEGVFAAVGDGELPFAPADDPLARGFGVGARRILRLFDAALENTIIICVIIIILITFIITVIIQTYIIITGVLLVIYYVVLLLLFMLMINMINSLNSIVVEVNY